MTSKRKEKTMDEEITILLAEDDDGHAALIQKNLKRAGLRNGFIRFRDGQETLDFLRCEGPEPHLQAGKAYLLLLDIRMPKVDGVEVLRIVKSTPGLRKIPVTMITTTDDPREVERCHDLGCSNYVTKPIDYDKFVTAIRQLGLFLKVVRIPHFSGVTETDDAIPS
jgi:CheY-like chemotaxis protein